MSVLISVPIVMAISQYSNLNHACAVVRVPTMSSDRAAMKPIVNRMTDTRL